MQSMPKYPRQFVNGEIYHLILRRVGNELLFGDIDDYYRGIFYIYECNTTQPITIRQRRRARAQFKKAIQQMEADIGQTSVKTIKLGERLVFKDERDLLVEVLAFCLMPNHIHLLVRQLKARGISKFIQKIASGYATYFKKKYGIKLKGHFFQDRFTALHIENEDQLRITFNYIHTNPIGTVEPDWKEKGIKNPKRAIEFLENYKWSSYQDYLGKKNFPSVTKREFLLKVMGGSEGCRQWVENWVEYKGELRKAIKNFPSLFQE